MEDWQNGGFGFYVHWPFCMAKCPYCDFNSHVSQEIDQSRWLRAYLSEVDRVAAEVGPRVLNTIYFGGGTPSLMDPNLVSSIIERIRKHWATSNDLEITLEANPTSIEASRFQGYADGGVNRISMGYQALNDRDLKLLGRMHTVKEGMQALDIAKNIYDRVSFDLIYARQNQTLEDWEEELSRALDLAIDHLSLYQLTIEEGTAFGDRYARGSLKGLPSETVASDMYFVTQELCAKAGMPAYEVSNHAKIGSESRHNLVYWRYGDYVGIGPGAHGRVTVQSRKVATETILQPTDWLDAVFQNGTGESSRSLVEVQDQASEFLMMGLRLSEGVSLDRFKELSGTNLNEAKLADLQSMEMIERSNDRLRATNQGRVVLNAILRELLVDL